MFKHSSNSSHKTLYLHAVLCQTNRPIQGSMLLQKGVTSYPRQHFRMENGGIVLAASRSESLENNTIPTRFQSPLYQRSLQNSFIMKSRGQENGFPKLPGAAAFYNQGQYSNQIIHGSTTDTSMRIGPMRPGRVLEEKRWHPFHMISNRWKDNGNIMMTKDVTFDNTSDHSHYLCKRSLNSDGGGYSIRPTDQGNYLGNKKMVGQFFSDKHDSLSKSNSCTTEFEAPFLLEVINCTILFVIFIPLHHFYFIFVKFSC